eukprot:374212-Prymnesium_polylepis.3
MGTGGGGPMAGRAEQFWRVGGRGGLSGGGRTRLAGGPPRAAGRAFGHRRAAISPRAARRGIGASRRACAGRGCRVPAPRGHVGHVKGRGSTWGACVTVGTRGAHARGGHGGCMGGRYTRDECARWPRGYTCADFVGLGVCCVMLRGPRWMQGCMKGVHEGGA